MQGGGGVGGAEVMLQVKFLAQKLEMLEQCCNYSKS